MSFSHTCRIESGKAGDFSEGTPQGTRFLYSPASSGGKDIFIKIYFLWKFKPKKKNLRKSAFFFVLWNKSMG